jgi:hypothetical protein
MGKAGRQRIERDFSLRRSADAFAALYRQAVSAPENDVPAAAAVRPNAG